MPAYVATNGLDEQLFLANEGQDWEVAKPVFRVPEKASASALLGVRDVMGGGPEQSAGFGLGGNGPSGCRADSQSLCAGGGESESFISALLCRGPEKGGDLPYSLDKTHAPQAGMWICLPNARLPPPLFTLQRFWKISYLSTSCFFMPTSLCPNRTFYLESSSY